MKPLTVCCTSLLLAALAAVGPAAPGAWAADPQPAKPAPEKAPRTAKPAAPAKPGPTTPSTTPDPAPAKPQARPGTYADEVQAVRAAIGFARRPKEIEKVIVLAEGDGAYLACLAAEYGGDADGYVLLNPPCGTLEELYAYRYGSLATYAGSGAGAR